MTCEGSSPALPFPISFLTPGDNALKSRALGGDKGCQGEPRLVKGVADGSGLCQGWGEAADDDLDEHSPSV